MEACLSSVSGISMRKIEILKVASMNVWGPGPFTPLAEIFPHKIMGETFKDHIVRLTFDF